MISLGKQKIKGNGKEFSILKEIRTSLSFTRIIGKTTDRELDNSE